MTRSADLIRFFVKRLPGIGRTLIVKYLYLADLEARKYLGRPLSEADYIWWDYGPFDSRILSTLEQLAQNELRAEAVTAGGKRFWRYLPDRHLAETHWSREDEAILNHVIESYGDLRLQTLLDDVVYQTKPMVAATQDGDRGCRLKMELVDNERRLPGVELDDVLQAIDDIDAGKGKPLRDVVARLRK